MAIEAEIKKTLGDFKLDIQFASKARRIGILGASGSGKSMILRCIAGIETPDQGSIRLEGNTVYDSLKSTISRRKSAGSDICFKTMHCFRR